MKNQLLYFPNGKVSLVEKDSSFKEEITSGFYEVRMRQEKFGQIPELYTSKIDLPLSSYQLAQQYVDTDFLATYFSKESQELHQDMKQTHKLGMILYGKHGTGKTTACYAVAEQMIKSLGAVMITVKSISEYIYALDFLKALKENFGNFLSGTVFDECEGSMQDHEDHMKRYLDSAYSLNNHIHFFTTNYIDNIPDSIKDRPSRIKFCIEIGGISDELAVFEILEMMNSGLKENVKMNDTNLKEISRDLIGKTLDEIKNKFIEQSFDINFGRKVQQL